MKKQPGFLQYNQTREPGLPHQRNSMFILASYLGLVLGNAGSTYASTAAIMPAHANNLPQIVIEHAELQAGENGGPDRAYIVIHNGTGNDARISRIYAAGYGPAAIMRQAVTPGEYITLPLDKAGLEIPKGADLDMKPDTLFVFFDRASRMPRYTTLSIVFDDGLVRSVSVDLIPSGRTPVSHHHGMQEED